jgi:hypothetical protein
MITVVASFLLIACSPAQQPSDTSRVEGPEAAIARGMPHYATGSFSSDDSLILRRAYGIEDPHRLYTTTSTSEGLR